MGRASVVTQHSLQSGLPQRHLEQFEKELDGWFDALKWLVKEFRLQVGYETPDEEAGVRFWIDRFKRRRGPPIVEQGGLLLDSGSWPTANKPVEPATEGEVAQARHWNQKKFQQQIERMFELRRQICPDTPILVPLKLNRASQNKTAALTMSVKEVRPPSATPIELKKAAPRMAPWHTSPQSAGLAARTRPLAQDRLFPTSAVGDGPSVLSDEQFASRVVDLAIEFDGDCERAARGAQYLLSTGCLAEEDTLLEREWEEGRSQLETLNLVRFWVQLPDKASLGLMVPAARAERLLEDRARGTTFAQSVFQVFLNRFGYECLDAGVLYRFWLSLPKSVRSIQHVRGTPDMEAFELLRLEARARAERRRAAQAGTAALGATPSASSSGSRPAWRPNGEAAAPASAANLPAVDPAAGIVGTATHPDLLAAPKMPGGALTYLKALMARFPRDLALQRMVRQCLGSAGVWQRWRAFAPAPTDRQAVLQVMQYLSGAVDNARFSPSDSPDKRGDYGAPKSGDVVLHDILQTTKFENLPRALEKLRDTEQMTKNINLAICRNASQLLKRGARVGALGPYFSSLPTDPIKLAAKLDGMEMAEEVMAGLCGRALVDELFARLCRDYGVEEVLERFGPSQYLPANFRGTRATAGLKGLLSAAPGRGGAVTYCQLQWEPSCSVLRPDIPRIYGEPAHDREVDGDPGRAWRPKPADQGFICSWSVDLGSLHSCVGVVLEWCLPPAEVDYPGGGSQILSDIRLRGGLGAPVEVIFVTRGGAADAAGVMSGNTLVFEPGSREEDAFRRLPIVDALTYLRGPLRLTFDRAGGGPRLHEPPPSVKVRISFSKDSEGDGAQYALKGEDNTGWSNEEVSVGEPTRIPAVFVGHWVRVELQNWPQVSGQLLHVAVRIVRVWRLAPPAFQRRFVEAMRRRAEKNWLENARSLERGCPYGMERECPCAIAANTDDLICPHANRRAVGIRGKPATASGLRGFWASAANKGTFNLRVKRDVNAYWRMQHDGEWQETAAEVEAQNEQFENSGRNQNKRWSLLQSKRRAWRRKIFAREEDARECTFHPRAAANVPVRVLRDHGGDPRDRYQRYDQPTTVEDFAKRIDFSSETNCGPYNNYQLKLRRKKFNMAKLEFAKGSLSAAYTKLKSSFGLSSIQDRFTCHEPGCRKTLENIPDSPDNPFCGKCLGYYCPKHLHIDQHNCQAVKEKMVDKKIKRKEDREEEEVFDAKDKPMWGLLLEVHEFAEQIRVAQRAKRQHRRSLELLGQSLVQFGAVRLLERPFKCRMCPATLASRKSPSPGVRGVARFCKPVSDLCCECENAHHPSELRFPAGESTARRSRWVQRSVDITKHHTDARPGSAASRSAVKKVNEECRQGQPHAAAAKRRASRRALSLRQAASSEARRAAMAAPTRDSLGGFPDSLGSSGLLSAARAQMREGDLEAARESLGAAREEAYNATWEAQAPQQWGRGGEPEAEAATAASRDLRAQIQALAAKTPPGTRPLRERERAALQKRGAAVAREARATLESCRELELEVARRDQEVMLEEFQIFRPGQERADDPDSTMPSPIAGQIALGLDGKTQMCVQFLELGSCSRGDACPFGHHPSELTQRSQQNLEELLRLSAPRSGAGLSMAMP